MVILISTSIWCAVPNLQFSFFNLQFPGPPKQRYALASVALLIAISVVPAITKALDVCFLSFTTTL